MTVAKILLSIGHFLYGFTLSYGVIGLAVGAFLESLGVPTGAAVIDLTAGLLIINHRASFLGALIVTLTGLVIGSLTSYYLGKAGSKVARYVRRNEKKNREHDSYGRNFIKNHGEKAVLLAQLFGPARTWISYPAGALGMDVKKFTIYTTIGGAIYCTLAIIFSLFCTSLIRSKIASAEHLATSPLVLTPLLLIPIGLLALHFIRARRSRAGEPAAFK
jgi:membrane protein DedA with SNARE-associated domain